MIWLRALLNPRVARAILNPKMLRGMSMKSRRMAVHARRMGRDVNKFKVKYGPAINAVAQDLPKIEKQFKSTYSNFHETKKKFDDVKNGENAKQKIYSAGKLFVKMKQLYNDMNAYKSDFARYKNMATAQNEI